jgi:hypothetical protein
MRPLAVDVHDKPDATGIVFLRGMVETLGSGPTVIPLQLWHSSYRVLAVWAGNGGAVRPLAFTALGVAGVDRESAAPLA